jgi:hypothetical protein
MRARQELEDSMRKTQAEAEQLQLQLQVLKKGNYWLECDFFLLLFQVTASCGRRAKQWGCGERSPQETTWSGER